MKSILMRMRHASATELSRSAATSHHPPQELQLSWSRAEEPVTKEAHCCYSKAYDFSVFL